MNYHGKSGASKRIIRIIAMIKISKRSINLVAILFLTAILFSKICNLQNVNMNYHAKSGASSLKIK